MGVLFAGFLRVPMTSVFMVLEVSGNYSIIVPVILANTIAYVISRAGQPVALFDMLTQQDGLDLPSMEEQREEVVLRIEDAMHPAELPVFEDSRSVAEAFERMGATDSPVLIRLFPAGWSTTSAAQLRRAKGEGKGEWSLREALAPKPIPYVFPDQPLEVALRQVQGWPLLPVVHRADFRLLLGVLTLDDVLHRYQTQLAEVPAKKTSAELLPSLLRKFRNA
jgi:CIC family chloride channel protein